MGMGLVCFYSKILTSDAVNLDFCECLLSGGQRLFSGLKSPAFCVQRPADGKVLTPSEIRTLCLVLKRLSSLWKRLPFDIEGPASAVKH
jgi:hypothetical protein